MTSSTTEVAETKVPEIKIIVPPALSYAAVNLRRDLAAAVDTIVPLLGQIEPINERVSDVADVLDPEHEG
jgi:hypothetical protein